MARPEHECHNPARYSSLGAHVDKEVSRTDPSDGILQRSSPSMPRERRRLRGPVDLNGLLGHSQRLAVPRPVLEPKHPQQHDGLQHDRPEEDIVPVPPRRAVDGEQRARQERAQPRADGEAPVQQALDRVAPLAAEPAGPRAPRPVDEPRAEVADHGCDEEDLEAPPAGVVERRGGDGEEGLGHGGYGGDAALAEAPVDGVVEVRACEVAPGGDEEDEACADVGEVVVCLEVGEDDARGRDEHAWLSVSLAACDATVEATGVDMISCVPSTRNEVVVAMILAAVLVVRGCEVSCSWA